MSERADAVSHFACKRCGQCCREPGYVYLTEADVTEIAAFLGINVVEFTAKHTRLTADRAGLSLLEDVDGACVFLGPQDECALQDVKPLQCRLFPHGWRYRDMESVCPGWQEGTNDMKAESLQFEAKESDIDENR